MKNSLTDSNIITKYQVACVLLYYNKCKMQFVSNDFNILKVNDSNSCTHVDNWIDAKKSLIHYDINVGLKLWRMV
jgi:hypothetical protein